MAISQLTKRDLIAAAERLGHPLPADRIEVVPLDADIRPAIDPASVPVLARWQLAGTSYALLVAAIEPRKNHALAFEA